MVNEIAVGAMAAAVTAGLLGLPWIRKAGQRQRHVGRMLLDDETSHEPPAESASEAIARCRLQELDAEVDRLRAVESDLLVAKREAEAAALAKGEFLATMSHEIRTPLNGILPILELVLGRQLDDEVRHQVAAAFESAREMRRIVNDVLDYSKLEAGAIQLEVASMRPGEIAHSVLALMKRSADAKHLRLTCEIDPAVPTVVRGDALRLRQLLTNLLGNAIKFTARGEIAVEITQVGEDRTHRTLRFAVRDTGAGIAPQAASKLFQPFSQADASMARQHGGTGLGLAICRRIVDAMGGRIGAESHLGRGSTFWFMLPLLRAAGEAVRAGLSEMHALLLTRDEATKELWTHNLSAIDIRTTTLTTAYEMMTVLRTTAQTRGADGLPQLLLIDLASVAKTAASVTRPVLGEDCFAAVRILLLGESAAGMGEGSADPRMMHAPRDLRDAAAHRAVRGLLDESPSVAGGPEIQLSNEPMRRYDGLRVLLVDDIAINRYAGQMSLEKLGAHVTTASGGREAIDMMRRQRFDMVLMDCQMPEIDGFAASRVQRLREREEGLPRLPILAVTANAMPGDRERCLAAGMDDYLSKPIELAALARMMGRWVASGRTPADALPRIEETCA